MPKPVPFNVAYGLNSLQRSGTDPATLESYDIREESSAPYVSHCVVRDSRNTPGFRALKASGRPLPINDFSSRECRVSGTVFRQETSQSIAGNDLVTAIEVRRSPLGAGLRPFYAVLPQSAYCYPQFFKSVVTPSDLYMKARADIRGEASNLSISAGEARETAKMFNQGAALMFKAGLMAAKGDVVGVVRLLGGYKPLPSGAYARLIAKAKVPPLVFSHWYRPVFLVDQVVPDVRNSMPGYRPAIKSVEIMSRTRYPVYKPNPRYKGPGRVVSQDTLLARQRGIELSRGVLDHIAEQHTSRNGGGLAAVQNAWMCWRYGVRPLMADIEAMAKHAGDRAWDLRSGIRALTTRIARGEEFSEPTLLSACGASVPATMITQIKEQRKLTVLYRVDDPDAREGAQIFGNVWQLAWELIPLSFVVDWFLPVGKYLDSLNATKGITFLDGYEGYKREVFSTFLAERHSNPRVVQGVSGGVRFVEVVRTRQRGIPDVSPLELSWRPNSDPAVNLPRLIDSAAILRNLVGKR